jgi:hypothetical protein
VSAPSDEERTLGAEPHRSSALDGAAAALTVARTRGVAMPLSWYWSHQPQGRACAAAPALRGTFDRTPNPVYFSKYKAKEKSQKKLDIATRKAEK